MVCRLVALFGWVAGYFSSCGEFRVAVGLVVFVCGAVLSIWWWLTWWVCCWVFLEVFRLWVGFWLFRALWIGVLRRLIDCVYMVAFRVFVC